VTDAPHPDPMTWLTQWYARQCDGYWEHSYGVSIDTLDNPGWLIKIDLTDTHLANKAFEEVAFNMDASDGDPSSRWHHCKVGDEQFVAACGVYDLLTVIGIFRAFTDAFPTDAVFTPR